MNRAPKRKVASKRKPTSKSTKKIWQDEKASQASGRTIARFPGAGFPDRLYIKMKYFQTVPVASSATDQVFCGNDIYDPDFTGTGGQPRYYDQLVQIYSRWRVRAAKLTMEYVNRGVEPFGVCVYPSSDSTTTSYANAVEQRDGVPNEVVWTSVASAKKLQCYTTTQAMLEFPDRDSISWGSASASPNQRWFFHCCAQNLTAIPTSNVGNAVYKIDYYVEFFDRFQIAPS